MFTEGEEVEAAIRRLEETGEVRLRVFGTSMMPTILPGASLRFERAEASALRIGDVALVRHERHFVIHRVVALHGGAVVTRGDGSPDDDAPVPSEAILGRAVGVPLLRGALPLGATAASGANELLGRVAPLLSALTRRARRFAGVVHRRHVQRGPVARLRRRRLNVVVRALENDDLSRVPRYLRRRGVRPSEGTMAAFRRAVVKPSEGRHFVVAVVDDGSIVGSVQLVPNGREAEVMDLFVRRSYRGLGLGRMLVSAAIAAAQGRSVSELTAQVRATPPSARGLFEALGFFVDEAPARRETHLVLRRGLR